MMPIRIQRIKLPGKIQNKMSKVIQRVEITLRSFYIFNSILGQKEGEEYKKVLFYYPDEIVLNTKIRDVGLSEALISFNKIFTKEDDCKALHTQKTTQLFYQPEPGFWLVMVLNVPKEIKLVEGVEVAEYRGAEVSDRIFQSVLRQCYYMYRFHHGKLQPKLRTSSLVDAAAAEEQRLQITAELKHFYDSYLCSFKDLAQCDIMDMLHSIQYLALDRALFLRAHNFSMLCDTFPAIKECVMFYNEQVVCGANLNASDLYSLHAHILATTSKAATSPDNIKRCGAFLLDSAREESPLRVYLDLNNQINPYYLLVYRALNFTLCLFVDAQQEAPKSEFYEELHAYMSPQLNSLASEIAAEVSRTLTGGHDSGSSDGSPKYLFINEQSLKHHTNINRHAKSIPRNVMNIIADLANPIDGNNTAAAATEEVQVKTTNDYWVVRRSCNWRQYYVILCKSKASLLDVTLEAKRIFELELKDDVFFDK